MRRAAALLLAFPAPLLAQAHDGVVHVRTHPELSDLALMVCAVAGVWLVRRAMRRRFAKPKD
jgi:hypothetical protein